MAAEAGMTTAVEVLKRRGEELESAQKGWAETREDLRVRTAANAEFYA